MLQWCISNTVKKIVTNDHAMYDLIRDHHRNVIWCVYNLKFNVETRMQGAFWHSAPDFPITGRSIWGYFHNWPQSKKMWTCKPALSLSKTYFVILLYQIIWLHVTNKMKKQLSIKADVTAVSQGFIPMVVFPETTRDHRSQNARNKHMVRAYLFCYG